MDKEVKGEKEGSRGGGGGGGGEEEEKRERERVLEGGEP